MDLVEAIKIAASGMKAQGTRLRVISENLANSDSTSETPGGDPYQRKTVSFRDQLDRASGADLVEVDRIGKDTSAFRRKYDPTHPGAGPDGYVLLPNVNPLIEMMDMREAQRSYTANLDMIENSKKMIEQTINLMRN